MQGKMNNQSNFEKEEQSWGISLSDFKSYGKGVVFKTMWYWHKQTLIAQRNSPEWVIYKSTHIYVYIYSQVIFKNGIKVIQYGKGNLFMKW